MSRRPASEHTIIRRSGEVLGLSALTVDELAERLVAEGLGLGPDPSDLVEHLLMDNGEFNDVGDRIVHGPTQLDGMSWCTFAEPELAAVDMLAMDPDLTALGWWLIEYELPLVDAGGTPIGGAVTLADDDEVGDVLVGPAGWLEPHRGRHVGVRTIGHGLHLEPIDRPPAPSTALVEAVRSAFARTALHEQLTDWGEDEPLGDLEFATLSGLVWSALVADRATFLDGPIPPIDLVLAAAGLERELHLVAPVGFDWEALHIWQQDARVARLYQLDDELVERLAFVMGASSLMIDGDPEAFGPPDQQENAAILLAVCLADPKVCRAFLGEHWTRQTDPDQLLEFAERLLEVMDGPGSGGPAYIAATCLDVLARPAEAEEVLTRSVHHDEHPLTLALLASLRADRGDAAGAMALLRRAGVTGEDSDLGGEVLREVAGYAAHRPRPIANRNDPCPCGSGRKYKACHLGKERHLLIDRAPWLHLKARRFVGLHERDLNAQIARHISRASGRGADILLQLLESELVADLTLCEGGVWDDFLAARHELLPDDEAMLAARWQLVERSLFEVERAEVDRLFLRDVRTGDRIEVTNTRNDRRTPPGTMLLGRPLPVDDTWRAFSGFVPVGGPLVQSAIDALDDGDLFAIAEVIGRCLAMPVMQNTDGHRLHFHEITWRIDDPASARIALDASGLTAKGDGTYSLVRDSANQNNTVIASFTLTDSTLIAEVNSDQRADEMVLLVAHLLPTSPLVDHDMWELGEMAGGDDDESPGLPGPDPDDPEVRAMLAEIMEQMEQRWLDESIPALGGATPREAAADPIGRHELQRLLQSFPDVDHPGAMSPTRLRAALGL